MPDVCARTTACSSQAAPAAATRCFRVWPLSPPSETNTGRSAISNSLAAA